MDIGATRPIETEGRNIGLTFALLGYVAVGAGLAVGEVVRPFPWPLAIALLAATAMTRRFGVALPGKWFVSFVPAAAASAAVALGWGAGGVIGCLGFIIGDVAFRRVPRMATFESAGHLAAGVAVGGGMYRLLGGRLGDSAFHGNSLILLVLLYLLVAITSNAVTFAQMRAAGTIGRVNPGLTLRWETVAAGFGMALGVSGVRLVQPGIPLGLHIGMVLVWLFFAGLSYFALRRGASAEGFLAVETLTRAIGARTLFADAFKDVRGLTGTLVPWHNMGLSRFDELTDEFVIIAETSPDVQAGFRFKASRALTAVALQRRGPVTDWNLSTEHRQERRDRGAEILVPLYVGGRLVGMWSVRHSASGSYWQSDAELLGRLATPLALAITLDSVVSPVLSASTDTAEQVTAISTLAGRLQQGSERAIADARRSAATVRRVAETLTSGAAAAQVNRQAAEANAASGVATRATGQEMLATARDVRATTMTAADRLRHAATVAIEGGEQIARLQEILEFVNQFRLAIEDVAYESGMLALNAAIEASRAGESGRGFAVVASEVRALAERSVREAQGAGRNVAEIQERLGRAAEIMERLRAEVGEAAGLGTALFERIDAIHQAAEQVAAIGEQIAATARETAERSVALATALDEGRRLADRAAEESDAVAAVSAEQGAAVQQLNQSATSLRSMATTLATSVARAREAGERQGNGG